MIDIVGTLNQSRFAFLFLLVGWAGGLIGFILKSIFNKDKILHVVLSDVLATILPSLGCLYLTFFHLKGVLYAYSVFCTLLGYVSAYYIFRKIVFTIKNLITKKRNLD